ncbi:MAG: Ppx/GppA family phosphatase [Acidobacteriia bacterium]|nr:Ppx/GppA family phosphatase [Terriglobia bacterium]
MADSPNNLLAAIDIGASSIRMDVAEVTSEGRLHILDALKKGVQLGKDTFTDGSVGEDSIRATCEALRDFKKIMDTYGVVRYRAVATSAVREAYNRDTFLDRVLMSTGLDIEVIDGSEENRLTYTAVLESLRGGPDVSQGQTLLVEAGGGSADVTMLTNGELLQSGTFPLGSIRLRASVGAAAGSHAQEIRLLKAQIANIVTGIRRTLPIQQAANYVAVGGDVRLAARIALGVKRDQGALELPREKFGEFVDSVSKLTIDQLVRKYSLSYLDAETLVPASLTYLALLMATSAQSVIISDASIRLGILLDLIPTAEKDRLTNLSHQILSAARGLGRKYQYDEGHADRVKELAELLFENLRGEQHMTETHRLYLQVAALLHDIGLFISSRSHHKHSYYLISQSDLFGLRRKELEIIANIARYHRRALPQQSHAPFMALDRDERMIVSKLGAILRVANSLDKEHRQKLADLKVTREGDQLVLLARTMSDLTMERLALASRSDFFIQVFGRKIVLREGSTHP